MKVTVDKFFNKRYKIRVGKHAGKSEIKIRVTFVQRVENQKKWIREYYDSGVFVDEREYESMFSSSGRNDDLKKLARKIKGLIIKAEGIIEKEKFLNPDIFEKQFTGSGSFENVINAFEQMAQEWDEKDSVNNAGVYRSAAESFRKFAGDHISFAEITGKWLHRYETWMLKEGKHRATKKGVIKSPASATSVSMYIRTLRSVYNRAIADKIVPADFYPFIDYQVAVTSGNKQPLDEDEKNRLRNFKTEDQKIRRALDFWVFSYLSYGLNMTDIARLKIKDIQNDIITLDRFKSRNTKRHKKKMEIPLHPDCKEIITRWGTRSLNPEDYLFPILREGLTAKQEVIRIEEFTRDINDGLRASTPLLKITKKLTTYIARHTFATLAQRRGVPKEFIQDALGHSIKGPVGNYMHGYDIEYKKQITMFL